MSKVNEFERWFNLLSSDERSQVLSHIISNNIEVCNEGVFTGVADLQLKGLYTGTAGTNNKSCSSCGRPF